MSTDPSPDQSVEHSTVPVKDLERCHRSREEWDRQFDVRRDRISVHNLHAETVVGKDMWGRRRAQPVEISVTIWPSHGFGSAARSDDLDESTVHYGLLCKELRDAILTKPHAVDTLWHVTEHLSSCIMGWLEAADGIVWVVELGLPKASAFGKSVVYTTHFGRSEQQLVSTNRLHLRDLNIPTVVGINSHEREMRQVVLVSVWIERIEDENMPDQYGDVEQIVVKTVEEAHAKTLEFLSAKIISNLLKLWLFRQDGIAVVRVKIDKPRAVVQADAAGVEMIRSSDTREGLAKIAWEECGRKRPDPIEFRTMDRLEDWMRRKGMN